MPDRQDFAWTRTCSLVCGAANLPAYLDACSAYGKDQVKEDPMAVNSLASKLLPAIRRRSTGALKIAADLARKAGKNPAPTDPGSPGSDPAQTRKIKDARKSALKARERAAGDPDPANIVPDPGILTRTYISPSFSMRAFLLL